ncbi:hypothetical protein ABT026_25410 [Streptomyces sp. NPDC002734]|uniref:Asp23/Gls24 family envelope stress response protein n=1 Tax=Streptomyces fragilis TaxID=67301 RepID=A0ABV2YN30_9ACTN|nr:hypothetical protein [Streptomyces fragilis]
MTARNTRIRDLTDAVRVRADGDVDEESLAYVREKVATALGRPGLGPVNGEVRVLRASAPHVELPWWAGADLQVGEDLVVVHVREATVRELADRLHDRLRGRVERVAHRAEDARRTSAPPPWRGGPGN